MPKFEDVPKSVLRPALEAFAHASGLGIFPDDEKDEDWREDLQNGMRASIAAALNAWPGAYHSKGYNTYFENYFDHVIVPLPQEVSDE